MLYTTVPCYISGNLLEFLKDYIRREWKPSPVFLPGELHGQGSLAGYSPWGRKESNMTEWLTHTHTFIQHLDGRIGGRESRGAECTAAVTPGRSRKPLCLHQCWSRLSAPLGLNLSSTPGFILHEPPPWWVQAVEPECPLLPCPHCQQSLAEGVKPCKQSQSHRSRRDPMAKVSLEAKGPSRLWP